MVASWTWKQLLKLRPDAMRFIKAILGNGKDISFWFDIWTPFGQLFSYLGPTGPRSLRIPIQAKVADACVTGEWKLPSPRSDEAVNLHAHLTTLRVSDSDSSRDCFEWCVDGDSRPDFSSTRTWQAMRPREDVKSWADLIWFKGSIPKHSFTMWIANYNRLPTRSRLTSWGMQIQKDCCLCSRNEETRDHLLLTCEYSLEVWRLVLTRLNPPLHMFRTWSKMLSWIKNSSSTAPSVLRKLVVQAVIFHLWKQRNNVLHNSTSLPTVVIYNGIEREVRNSLSARRHKRQFRDLMSLWFG